MPNIFFISADKKLSLSKNKILINGKEENFQIKPENIRNIFILNNQKLSHEVIEQLKNRKINIFLIDEYGNLNNVFLGKKKTKAFISKNPEKVSSYIVKREIYSINSFILRSNIPLKKSYSSNYLKSMFYFFDENLSLEKFRSLHKFNLQELYSIVKTKFSILHFNRSYKSKNPINTTINYLHTFSFCFLYSWFNFRGINVYASDGLFCDTTNSNYPSFLKVIFTQFRIHATITGLYIYENLLVKSEDFSYRGSLSQMGKLIISKVFTEKFIHNYKVEQRLKDFWEDIIKI